MAWSGTEPLLLAAVGGWLQPAAFVGDLTNIVFFQEVNAFLRDEIEEFGVNLLGRTLAWVGSLVLVAMTLWIMLQGYRIVTGQSREPMMALVGNSLRAVLVIGVATGIAIGGGNLYGFLADDLVREVAYVVSGSDEDPYARIDRSLGYMQFALASIDGLNTGRDAAIEDVKQRNLWFTGIGIAGPAITGGALLLLNKVAMALFIGLGPIFVLALLFDQTKALFGRWLYYGIGTMFSLAVLSVMVSLALDMLLAVSAAFWVGSFRGGSVEGINSMALQQGGLGLILTMLILGAPPMAAAFFQGVLANFSPYTAFGSDGGRRAAADPTAGAGYPPGTGPVHSAPMHPAGARPSPAQSPTYAVGAHGLARPRDG